MKKIFQSIVLLLLFLTMLPEISGQSALTIEKIMKGELLLVGTSGAELPKKATFKVSGSNTYDSSVADKGEMFNLRDENFKMSDPSDPLSSSDRISEDSAKTGTQWSSQK